MFAIHIGMLAILSTLAATCSRGGVSASRSSNRILSMEKAEPGKYPFLAEIEVSEGGKKWTHSCGGTVVSKHHVLAAAGCVTSRNLVVKPEILRVRLGCDQLSRCSFIGSTYNVSQIMVHPKFQRSSNGKLLNDVAILKLASKINFNITAGTGAVGIISLADSTGSCCDKHRRRLKVIGWGVINIFGSQTDQLREAEVDSIPLDDCNSNWKLGVNNKMICAGNSTKNICAGDSGGPLLMTTKKRGTVQVGIIPVSMGVCGRKPMVGTKVAPYRTWIGMCIGKKGCPVLEQSI